MNTKGQIQNKRNKLIFSRWSRKSWAVFCSIGREVKIAVLKLVVADGFIKKSNAGINVHEVVRNEEMDSGDSSGDSKIKPANPISLLLNLIQSQNVDVSGGRHELSSEYSMYHNKLHPFLYGKDFLFLTKKSSKSKYSKQKTATVMLRNSKHDLAIMKSYFENLSMTSSVF